MMALSLPRERLRPHYDSVVVGSGYGGGIAAARLAQAGWRVAVLERGREVRTGEFPKRLPDLRREIQLSGQRLRVGAPTGLYDVRLGEDMHVVMGCGLGGGSLINAGVALRPDPRVWLDPAWPGEIGGDGHLERGYQLVELMLRPTLDSRAKQSPKFNALMRAGSALRARSSPASVAVTFEDTANPAGVFQPACTRCGDCCSGCNVGAKNTIPLCYLPIAMRHRAEIFTHVTVRHVAKASDGRWFVHVCDTKSEHHAGHRTTVVTADNVILSAGSLGSTEILLRSREHGLPLGDQLGHSFSANGDAIAFGYGANTLINAIGVGYPSKIDNLTVGACVTGQVAFVDPDDVSNSITLVDGVLPSALAPILPVLFLPTGRIIGALHSLISGVYQGPFARLQTFFAVSHDHAAGRLVLESDRIVLRWPGAQTEPVHQRIEAAVKAVVEQNGGTYIRNPLAATVGHQPMTAHPLGGCGTGVDSYAGVVDHRGRVFDAESDRSVHKGLYVIDGSTIPCSLGVNPLLTIAALAERAMMLFDHKRHDDGR